MLGVLGKNSARFPSIGVDGRAESFLVISIDFFRRAKIQNRQISSNVCKPCASFLAAVWMDRAEFFHESRERPISV
jgi:hypothetical protein